MYSQIVKEKKRHGIHPTFHITRLFFAEPNFYTKTSAIEAKGKKTVFSQASLCIFGHSSYITALVSEGLFNSLWDNHSFLYLKLFNCVYYFWGLSMSTISKHFAISLPFQANHKFGIKQIVFCTQSFKKGLYLTKTGSWRTPYGLPFFSTWVMPLLFTNLEVSKEYFKKDFQ